MPDDYFQLSRQNQASALAAASDFSGRAPHLLEKDIWVVWALATLFRSDLGANLVFKGERDRRCYAGPSHQKTS